MTETQARSNWSDYWRIDTTITRGNETVKRSIPLRELLARLDYGENPKKPEAETWHVQSLIDALCVQFGREDASVEMVAYWGGNAILSAHSTKRAIEQTTGATDAPEEVPSDS